MATNDLSSHRSVDIKKALKSIDDGDDDEDDYVTDQNLTHAKKGNAAKRHAEILRSLLEKEREKMKRRKSSAKSTSHKSGNLTPPRSRSRSRSPSAPILPPSKSVCTLTPPRSPSP